MASDLPLAPNIFLQRYDATAYDVETWTLQTLLLHCHVRACQSWRRVFQQLSPTQISASEIGFAQRGVSELLRTEPRLLKSAGIAAEAPG